MPWTWHLLRLGIMSPIGNPSAGLDFLPLCKILRTVMVHTILTVHLGLLILLLLGCRPVSNTPKILRMPSISSFLPVMTCCQIHPLRRRFLYFIPAQLGRIVSIWPLLLESLHYLGVVFDVSHSYWRPVGAAVVRSVRGGSGEGASSDADALVHAAILGESTDAGLRVVVHLVHPGAAHSGTRFGLADLMLVRGFRGRRDAWELTLLGCSIRSRRYRRILTPSAILYYWALVALILLMMPPCRC